MNFTKILASVLIVLAPAFACAATVDEARELINAGDYDSALSVLQELTVKEPKNTTVLILIGDCYRAIGRDAEAVESYEKARAKGSNEARLGLIEIAVREYRLDDADQLLADYRKALKKGRKTLPDNSEDATARLDKTRNMLNRVERIVVFDSINVPVEDFFNYYRLSSESGSLNAPSVLPSKFEAAAPTVVYEPESRTEMMWSAPDEDQNYRLVNSVALYGNEWDAPRAVGDHLGEGGDANYPFMMPDGITLYYANDGENSLGGYDIFISRRDGNGFLQPQNLGMPYNSPYNDYMLAIDETTGVGWWASDRNRVEGMVTIYMFIPAEMRVNVDVNAADLRQRASLSSIAVTQEPGVDYSDLKESVAAISKSAHRLRRQCYFPLPDGRVITRLEQLSDSDARLALRRYIDLKSSIDADSDRLSDLRATYAAGDQSVAGEILRLEKQAVDDIITLKHAANEVIAAECPEYK